MPDKPPLDCALLACELMLNNCAFWVSLLGSIGTYFLVGIDGGYER